MQAILSRSYVQLIFYLNMWSIFILKKYFEFLRHTRIKLVSIQFTAGLSSKHKAWTQICLIFKQIYRLFKYAILERKQFTLNNHRITLTFSKHFIRYRNIEYKFHYFILILFSYLPSHENQELIYVDFFTILAFQINYMTD